jgi:hypothetical protein
MGRQGQALEMATLHVARKQVAIVVEEEEGSMRQAL